MLLNHHDVFDQHLGVVRKNPQHTAFFALIAAGNDTAPYRCAEGQLVYVLSLLSS